MRIILFFSFISVIFAQEVILAKKNIKYKEYINLDKVYLGKINKVSRNCEVIDESYLLKDKYIAKHYIPKNMPICKKDIERYKKNVVVFDFGSFEIEKVGKVIYENDDFIKIRTPNGKIEKIYKSGIRR